MQPVIIDYEKCNEDGICADVCPRKLIAFAKDNSKPIPIPEMEELCISCGHCLAVCPSGAISLKGSSPDECAKINKKLWPGYDQLDHLLRSRRSIRVYKDKPVDRRTIGALLDTCRYAPSGSNSQPVKWIIASGRDRLLTLGQMVIDWMKDAIDSKHPLAEKLPLSAYVAGWEKGEDRIFRNAPMVLMAHAAELGSLPSESSVIAMTYFELAATSKGLGVCWIGFLMLAANLNLAIKKSLGIPEDHKLYGALSVGYPKYAYQRIPPRNQADVVWW